MCKNKNGAQEIYSIDQVREDKILYIIFLMMRSNRSIDQEW